ncbi:MAG TPA: PD-(D/E)XK nuclease family protein, partial [Rhodocyclaceae bacterium]|nr:PD-(D/E)XK nuclease family protein [Rhodocyclaceae bacterium]
RVRIMTIHGAKGLESPIVWLLDANAAEARKSGYDVVLEWPADADAPKHFSLMGSYGRRGRARKHIFESEELAARRENLNLLYVALTRAEQIFIASGIESRRTAPEESPYQKLARALNGGSDEKSHGAVFGDMPYAKEICSDESEQTVVAPLARQPLLNVGTRRERLSDSVGQAFGRQLHAWLEAVTQGLPQPKLMPEFARTVPQAARRILDKPDLKRFFDPAQYVQAGNELSFVGGDGLTGRIDRWVDTGDALWVLDYKSGNADSAAQYREQLAVYVRAMQAVWPGRVIKSMLIFTDGNEIVLD